MQSKCQRMLSLALSLQQDCRPRNLDRWTTFSTEELLFIVNFRERRSIAFSHCASNPHSATEALHITESPKRRTCILFMLLGRGNDVGDKELHASGKERHRRTYSSSGFKVSGRNNAWYIPFSHAAPITMCVSYNGKHVLKRIIEVYRITADSTCKNIWQDGEGEGQETTTQSLHEM